MDDFLKENNFKFILVHKHCNKIIDRQQHFLLTRIKLNIVRFISVFFYGFNRTCHKYRSRSVITYNITI